MNLEERYEKLKHIAFVRTGTKAQPAKIYLLMFCRESRMLMNTLRGLGSITTVLAFILLRSHPVLAALSIPFSISLVWFGMSQADVLNEVMLRIKTDVDFDV